MEKPRILFIGVDGEKTVDSAQTATQIAEVEKLKCAIWGEGKPCTWKDFNDPEEPRTLFQAVLKDREDRVDKGILMADRPNFCVITAVGNRAVRLEYYEGHDALSLVYDLRAPELAGKGLPKFLDEDPMAYDPVRFLRETFGLPEWFTRPLLEKAHKEEDT